MRVLRTLGRILGILLVTASSAASEDKVWIHGSADCDSNRDPAIDVHRFDDATYILRQNKCVHFEAPFIHVLFGNHTVFVQDTGATEEAARSPVYDTVLKLIAERKPAAPHGEYRILVTHSHSHGDHTAGDAQFRGKPGFMLVEPRADAVRKHFGFTNWPDGVAKVDLGGRELLVMPIPGHQEESLAVYDSRTRWLLTGDTVLPGRLYVRDWDVYRASIAKLAAFAKQHPVSAVMGTHIEMSAAGRLYPGGSTYQPDEAPLALTADDLAQLDAALQKAGSNPQEIAMRKFVVVPVSAVQRVIGNALKWATGG